MNGKSNSTCNRRSNRVPFGESCFVSTANNKELECQTLNISAGGIAFVSDDPFEIEEVISVRFQNDKVIDCRVRFCMNCEDGNFQVGANFVDEPAAY